MTSVGELALVPLGRRWNKARQGSIVLLLVILLAGCGERDERVQRLFSLLLRESDLPPGWHYEDGGIGDRNQVDHGVLTRWIGYRGPAPRGILGGLVSHELIDYADINQAILAYPEVVREQMPTRYWEPPEPIDFESSAAQFRLACVDVRTDDQIDPEDPYGGPYFCTAVGRYESMISILNANVHRGEWLTFEDLQDVLEVIDARLAAQP